MSALEPVMASQVVSADRFLAVGLKSDGWIGDEGIRHGQLRRGCMTHGGAGLKSVPRRRWPLPPSPQKHYALAADLGRRLSDLTSE